MFGLLLVAIVSTCSAFPNYRYLPELIDDYLAYRDAPETQGFVQDINWPDKDLRSSLGQVAGIATAQNGDVYLFHRGKTHWDEKSFFPNNTYTRGPIAVDTIIRVDQRTGKKLGKLGSGKFYMPHGLTIDDQGNIWVTDVGLHQVMRIPKGDSDPDLVLGHKLEPGSDRTHFCKPTDVAVAKNGDFFVSDGYCNNRIMKFSKKGDFLKQWGSPVGNGGLTGTSFAVPHSLALVEDKDLICVADRENARVMCFSAGLHDNSQTGAFRLQLVEPGTIGRVYAIAYQPTDDVMYAVVDPSEKEARARGYTLGFDGRTPEAWGRVTKADVSLPHDVSVSPDGRSIYLGDIATTPGKAIKYEKTEPNQAQYIF